MPGTLVQDVLAPTLLNTTVAATGTVNGSSIEVAQPRQVAVEMALGAITGTSVTFDVEVQGSDDNTFATGVVSYGRFGQVVNASASTTFYLNAYAHKRYMRVKHITAGTSPSIVVAIKVREPHDRRVAGRSA